MEARSLAEWKWPLRRTRRTGRSGSEIQRHKSPSDLNLPGSLQKWHLTASKARKNLFCWGRGHGVQYYSNKVCIVWPHNNAESRLVLICIELPIVCIVQSFRMMIWSCFVGFSSWKIVQSLSPFDISLIYMYLDMKITGRALTKVVR